MATTTQLKLNDPSCGLVYTVLFSMELSSMFLQHNYSDLTWTATTCLSFSNSPITTTQFHTHTLSMTPQQNAIITGVTQCYITQHSRTHAHWQSIIICALTSSYPGHGFGSDPLRAVKLPPQIV